MVDGQVVSWREDRAALGQGWAAQAEKKPRARAECPPFSLWRARGASGSDRAVVFQRTKRCQWSRGCVTARPPGACAPSPSRTASPSRSAAAAASARAGATAARSAPRPAQVRCACLDRELGLPEHRRLQDPVQMLSCEMGTEPRKQTWIILERWRIP